MDAIVPSVTIRFALREAEVAAAIRIVWQRGPFARLLAVVGVGFILWGLVDIIRGANQTHAVTILMSGIAIVGLLAIFLLVYPRLLFRTSRQMRDEQAQAFSTAGFEVAVSDVRSTIKWSFYQQAIVTRDLYLLLRNHRLCNVIPRRAFKTAADDAVFRHLLDRHVHIH